MNLIKKIFVGQMHKILFNHINIIKCELFYCIWCMQFTKKSKFSIDDTPDSNQSCKCYIIFTSKFALLLET